MIALMTLTLVSATSMPAFAGMNNAISEDFFDDLPEIEVEASEKVPEDSKEQEETEAPVEESKDEKSEETEPETKAEVTESQEETKTTEAEPEKKVVVKEDNDNTPEKSSRVIYAHRNVVICDNEPIMTTEAVPETEIETTIFDAPEEEETTVAETETVPVKVPTSSSLPKTADFSDLMIAGVAVMVIVAAAFAVVANRRKRA